MTAPLKVIRKNILDLSQVEMAALTGTTQATVSRWENGELEPDRGQLAMIRAEAAARGVPWNDTWFFEVPAEDAA
jgi:DNA-binding transcriptional regulator YiaG